MCTKPFGCSSYLDPLWVLDPLPGFYRSGSSSSRIGTSAHTTRTAWSFTREERLGRLCRELRNLGLDLTEDLPSQVPGSWDLAQAFLEPEDDEELGRAMVPGAARSVAGKLAEEWQRGRADAAAELRNWDRTEQEIARKEGDRRPLTVLLSDLSPQEVGCLLRTCEAAGVQEVVLCDDTPGPPDPAVLKTSLQAEDFLRIRRVAGPAEELRRLASAGMQVWTLNSDSDSDTLGMMGSAKQEADFFDHFAPRPPLALGLGRRIAGFPRIRVPGRQAAAPDVHLSIGVIGSVVIYDLIRRLRKIPKIGKIVDILILAIFPLPPTAFGVLPTVTGPSWAFHNLNYSCLSMCQDGLVLARASMEGPAK
ncbi:unnamed protein product [Symbiodinium sp. KB8]|nr:unnamed protein product [Symbiodinium sp. KB8]